MIEVSRQRGQTKGDRTMNATTKTLIATTLLLGNLTQTYAQQAHETTEADQTDVAVTVYNENRALVRDRRTLQLSTGEIALKFMDVAQRIQPETVSLKSLSRPGSLQILEQNYEFDLMNPAKLMEKYVGRKVRLINKHKDMDFFEQEATLLSVNGGAVYEVNGEIYLGHPGTVVLPELPEELIAKPSLIWLLNNQRDQQEIEASYLTGGISWKADYIVKLNRNETSHDLDGWVTLNNQSGATYNNAQLKLVAGDVNITRQPQVQEMMTMSRGVAMAKAAPMREESFADFHLYTLPRRTTIKQNQSKQVSLLTAEGIKSKRVYEYRGNASYYSRRMQQFQPEKVATFLEFKNEKDNKLGIPLPAGIMRVYQEDSEGMLQFAGEDRVKHTPKDEKIRLRLGTAFDLVAERRQTHYEKIASNIHEAEFEITLRNHKESDVIIAVIEPVNGDWQMISNTMDFEKRDAFTAVFHANVPADGETTITYRVRARY